jgi:ribosomal protein L37AE/L43A
MPRGTYNNPHKPDECPHCLFGELEYMEFHNWHCKDCGTIIHDMSTTNVHWWGAGEVHVRPDIDEECDVIRTEEAAQRRLTERYGPE